MMNTAHITNRAAAVALSPSFEIPKDGKFHLARKGEFPGEAILPNGKTLRVIQVIDETAISTMVDNFRDYKKAGGHDLLVDRDHLSHDDENETVAEGWIQNVEGKDNLFAEIKPSKQGKEDIEGGNYRFISGEWDITPIGQKDFTEGCRVRPIRLTGAGLTNRPNITGLAALSNREKPLPDDPANSPAEQADIQNRKTKTMKQIASKLGLSADASEDAILGELAKVMNRADTAEQKLKPIEDELATVKNRLKETEESSADQALESAGIKKDDADYATIRTAIITNREGGLALLKKIKPATAKPAPESARMTNREKAKTPGDNAEASKADPKSEIQAGAIRNRATALMSGPNKPANFRAAWKQAKSELATAGAN